MAMTIQCWTRYNLFATPSSAVLSIVSIPLTIYVAFLAVRWAMVDARWSVITDYLVVLLVGTFPRDQLWRTMIAGAVLSLLVGLTIGVVLATRLWKASAILASVCLVAAALSFALHQQAVAGAL